MVELGERREERLKAFSIRLPAADRTSMKRAAHLIEAGGAHGPFEGMEVEAARIPGELERVEKPSRFEFKVVN